MLTPKQFTEWVAALRSGRYKQGHGQLRNAGYSPSGPTDQMYDCCLAVLIDTIAPQSWVRLTAPGYEHLFTHPLAHVPQDADDKIGTSYCHFSLLPQVMNETLSTMNDGGASFEEIADYLEDHRADIVQEDL